MWVRIAAHYPVAHSPMCLANYRVHNSNISSQYFLSGQNMRDIAKVIDINQQYLPSDEKTKLTRAAKRNWSHYFARASDMTYGRYKSPHQALVQSRMAFSLHQNSVSLYYLVKTYLKVLLRYKQR
jgi:hypothetical protein